MEYLAIASAAMNVIGAISGGNQQAKQFEAYAAANQYNAAVERQRADTTRASYGQREEQQRRQARFALGNQRANAAQSGLGLGGSVDDLERQSEVFAEMDALNIRYEGELTANGLLSQAGIEEWQAANNRASAKSVKRSSYIGAAGAALSGTGNYLKLSSTTSAPTLYGLNGSYGTGSMG